MLDAITGTTHRSLTGESSIIHPSSELLFFLSLCYGNFFENVFDESERNYCPSEKSSAKFKNIPILSSL